MLGENFTTGLICSSINSVQTAKGNFLSNGKVPCWDHSCLPCSMFVSSVIHPELTFSVLLHAFLLTPVSLILQDEKCWVRTHKNHYLAWGERAPEIKNEIFSPLTRIRFPYRWTNLMGYWVFLGFLGIFMLPPPPLSWPEEQRAKRKRNS